MLEQSFNTLREINYHQCEVYCFKISTAILFPGGSVGKENACNIGDRLQYRRPRFDPWVGKIPWRKKWQTTPVFLPGEAHGQKSLAGYSLWGHKSLT